MSCWFIFFMSSLSTRCPYLLRSTTLGCAGAAALERTTWNSSSGLDGLDEASDSDTLGVVDAWFADRGESFVSGLGDGVSWERGCVATAAFQGDQMGKIFESRKISGHCNVLNDELMVFKFSPKGNASSKVTRPIRSLSSR